MRADRWEMGSELHWDDSYLSSDATVDACRRPTALFSTARAAMGALAEHLGARGTRLHLPTYFCPSVTASFAEHFTIAWYRDDPLRSAPDFSTIDASDGDIVLAVNYFGIRKGSTWNEWVADHPDVVVVEDHSHDPSVERSVESSAHFVVSSIRKALPLPDGAVIMSPAGLPIPAPSGPSVASMKLEAMLLKAMYLRGLGVDKETFRALYLEGDQLMISDGRESASIFTRQVLPQLDMVSLQQARERNVRRMIDTDLIGVREGLFTPLFRSWPEGATPFNYVIATHDAEIRGNLRRHLIEHRVYPAVHWIQQGSFASPDPASIDLGNRLLTIPVDHRYDEDDLERLVGILNDFKA